MSTPAPSPPRRAAPAPMPRLPLLLAAVLLVLVFFALLAGVTTPPYAGVEELRPLANRWAREYRIDPDLVLAVTMVESGGDPRARSRAGARGLMQLLPTTAQDLAGRLRLDGFEEAHLDDPDLNLRLGTYYLRWLAERFGEDRPATILAAYNAGYGTVRRWLAEIPPLATGSADEQLVERIDYPETRAYVRRVLDTWSILKGRRQSG